MAVEEIKNPLEFVEQAVLRHMNFTSSGKELEEIAHEFKILSGSRAVAFNEVAESGNFTITRAFTGINQSMSKLSEILGFSILNKSYDLDPEISKAFCTDELVKYDSISRLSRFQIPEVITSLAERLFSIGEVYVLGLMTDDKLLGDLVFFTSRGEKLLNRDMLKLYGRHFALFLYQSRRCQKSVFNLLAERAVSGVGNSDIFKNFYKLTESFADIFYQLDDEGRIIFINYSIEKYGYKAEELIGSHILEIIHPDDREHARWNLMERRTDIRKTANMEIRIINKNSEEVYFKLDEKTFGINNASSLYSEGLYEKIDDRDIFKGTIGFCRDITAEKKLQVQIDNQSEIFKIMAENIDAAIWLEQISPPKRLYANSAAAKMFSLDTSPDDSNPAGFLAGVHPEDREKVKSFLINLSEQKFKKEIEYRLFHNDTVTWIHSSIFPVYNNSSLTGQIVGIASDVTFQRHEKEKLRLELDKNQVYLKESNHRIKNNLSTIENILKLEALNLKDRDSQTGEILLKTRNRIKSIGLLHNMLYEGSEGGRIELNLYLTQLSRSIIQYSTLAGESPEVEIEIDRTYLIDLDDVLPLGMILSELITNAIKYAFTGQQAGTIHIGFSSSGTGTFELEVSDNGRPMKTGNIHEKSIPGIGMDLIKALSAQLNGSLETGIREGFKFFLITFRSDRIKIL